MSGHSNKEVSASVSEEDHLENNHDGLSSNKRVSHLTHLWKHVIIPTFQMHMIETKKLENCISIAPRAQFPKNIIDVFILIWAPLATFLSFGTPLILFLTFEQRTVAHSTFLKSIIALFMIKILFDILSISLYLLIRNNAFGVINIIVIFFVVFVVDQLLGIDDLSDLVSHFCTLSFVYYYLLSSSQTLRGAKLSAEGIRFIKRVGTIDVDWQAARIRPCPSSEIRWLRFTIFWWRPFFSKDPSLTIQTDNFYRIEWNSRVIYFSPSDISLFEEGLEKWYK